MKIKANPGFIWHRILKTYLFFLIFLGVGSCKEDDIVDLSPLIHGWQVVSYTTPESGTPQVAGDTYLVEFIRGNYYAIDFDRGGCGSTFSVTKRGAISLDPHCGDICSQNTKYSQDLQKTLLATAGYSVKGDSLKLTGDGEIVLVRALDCDGVGCQKNIVYFYLTIKHKDGSAVALTSSKLIRLSDNATIVSHDYTGTPPEYNLIDDNYRKQFAGKTVNVEFQGFIDGTMVVDKTFTITADCCHVYLESGDVNIVID